MGASLPTEGQKFILARSSLHITGLIKSHEKNVISISFDCSGLSLVSGIVDNILGSGTD
jgi:hypothetical protein